MAFPSVSYPTSRLANLLNRAVAKVESHFKEDADVTSNLEERIDLDVVSIPLLKMGLKQAHLMEEETVTRQEDELVSNEIVVDLESFRINEWLPDKFTSKCRLHLGGQQPIWATKLGCWPHSQKRQSCHSQDG